MTKLFRIGVVGYCPPTKFDEVEATRMIREAFDKATEIIPAGSTPTVVSGLTNVGVLKIAYEEARSRGWRTEGVACKRAEEHELFPVDEKIIVGDNWGDESSRFLENLDCMVRIGTGKQSVRETDELKARGKPTFEYDLPTLS